MTIELTEARKKHILEDYARGFIAYCGFQAVAAGPGYFESRVAVRDEHRQQDGFIHAGVMATLADHTAGYAAFTLVPEDHQILTVEFKVNFLRPAFGEALVCRARVLKPGRRLLVCESEVFDLRSEGEVLAAKVQATMAAVPAVELEKGWDNGPPARRSGNTPALNPGAYKNNKEV
ncbi:MAG: PaaI family thioesterase [Thermodesulfobacteriota bacterium]